MPWLVLVLVVTGGEDPEHIAVIVEGAATVVQPADAPGDIVAQRRVPAWLRLDARRVLSYADEGTAG